LSVSGDSPIRFIWLHQLKISTTRRILSIKILRLQ